MMRAIKAVLAALSLAAACAVTAHAAPTIPYFWDPGDRLAKPDLSELARLRFLTTTDFRPFNFLDEDGRLAGFHVDLARAICAKLDVEDRCQIQALPWDELGGAIAGGEGEAILAGLAITRQNRKTYAFSRSYLRFPARFVMRADAQAAEPLEEALAGKRVGVLDNTAHERMLRDLFPRLRPVVFSRRQWMLDALGQGAVDAVFGDGMTLASWLADDGSQGCCAFAGGPYISPEYLGHGLAIAVPKESTSLVAALDYALQQIEKDGTFAELYLRYFPVSFY